MYTNPQREVATDIAGHLTRIRARVDDAARRFGRDPQSITLLAVSKTQPADRLREAWKAGQRCFGESYLQEALNKLRILEDLPAQWHFIGPIQTNKTKPIAENFDWVHSIDRLKVARRLSEQRPGGCPPLQVCLQVNISGEASKSGTTLAELAELAARITELPGLRLRGLMALPAATDDFERQREPFRKLREAMEILNREGLGLDTLSMGMSADLEAAIAEGATVVRVGSGIFGPRRTGASQPR
ncbi:MAG: YggS family pyridoxal phosphate-dependent enzyme [Gammaproteobacteria bacterium]